MGLLDRDPTPEDLEAERDRPRHGVWAGEPDADLRALTQEETDQLIRAELCMSAPPGELEEIQRACGLGTSTVSDGRPTRPMFDVAGGARRIAWYQRGGIDSDPLVRVLARRAWGDRDRSGSSCGACGRGMR